MLLAKYFRLRVADKYDVATGAIFIKIYADENETKQECIRVGRVPPMHAPPAMHAPPFTMHALSPCMPPLCHVHPLFAMHVPPYHACLPHHYSPVPNMPPPSPCKALCGQKKTPVKILPSRAVKMATSKYKLLTYPDTTQRRL